MTACFYIFDRAHTTNNSGSTNLRPWSAIDSQKNVNFLCTATRLKNR